VRTAIQALAAVLGGTQSLHTNSLDEAYALPSEQAVTLALRTQQIIAHESGVASVADPLGGSYFLERLTAEVEDAANGYIRSIDEAGGMIPAIEAGFPQREIAQASFEYQQSIEAGRRKIAGVNAFMEQNTPPIELLQIDESAAGRQVEKLEALRKRRSSRRVTETLDALKRAAEGTQNTMPFILDAVRAYATVGEICGALKQVFGTYQEKSIL
jgi:methylmalonyl-CoA mutase N-terminal domain/subunit